MAKKAYKKPEISKKQLEKELMEVNEALWQANQKLKAEEKARTELLANLSHDLRASMSALVSSVELLKSGRTIETEEYQKILNLMENRLRFQRSLLEDLFLLAKLESKSQRLNRQKVECRMILEEYFYSCMVDSKYKRCQLKLLIPEEFPYMVEVDAQMIVRVLDNLFSNALKHSRSDVEISLGAMKHGEEVWIFVQDNGRGISAEDLPFIFDRTFRGSRARSPKEGGSGLGLAIAKEIVKEHGGEIWCTSIVNEGSCFTFSLPKISRTEGDG
jgi:signal transduction histidine kinase